MTPLLLLALAASPDAGAPEPGLFTKQALQRVVRRHHEELRLCADRHWGYDVELTLTFTMSPEGRVRDTAMESINQTDSSELVSCVISALRSWSFPSPGKKSVSVEHFVIRLPPTPPKK
jgi:hypothetical protein